MQSFVHEYSIRVQYLSIICGCTFFTCYKMKQMGPHPSWEEAHIYFKGTSCKKKKKVCTSHLILCMYILCFGIMPRSKNKILYLFLFWSCFFLWFTNMRLPTSKIQWWNRENRTWTKEKQYELLPLQRADIRINFSQNLWSPHPPDRQIFISPHMLILWGALSPRNNILRWETPILLMDTLSFSGGLLQSSSLCALKDFIMHFGNSLLFLRTAMIW